MSFDLVLAAQLILFSIYLEHSKSDFTKLRPCLQDHCFKNMIEISSSLKVLVILKLHEVQFNTLLTCMHGKSLEISSLIKMTF